MDDSERLDKVCAALGIDRDEIESLPEMVKVVGYDGEFIGFYRAGNGLMPTADDPKVSVFEVLGTVDVVLEREFKNREYWRETLGTKTDGK